MAALLLAPVAAAGVDLALPDGFRVADATLLAGAVQAPGLFLRDPVVAVAHGIVPEGGNLTVCPVAGYGRGFVATVLGTLRDDCAGGTRHTKARVEAVGRTDLAFAGREAVAALPAAALVAPFADANGTLAMVAPGRYAFDRADDLSRLQPLQATASLLVHSEEGDAWYNGTAHAFLFDARRLDVDADAVAGLAGAKLHLTVQPAGRGQVAAALQPYLLLDLQEALLGPDAREPRANVTAVVGEFGRVPALADGALLGRLNGTVAGEAHTGEVALVRANRMDLQRQGGRLVGDADANLAITPHGVALDGRAAEGPPWLLGGLLWAVAVAVVLVRRTPPARPAWLRGVWVGVLLLGALLVDRLVLEPRLGTGAWTEAGARNGGAALTMAAFGLAATLGAYVLVALPVRTVLGRVVPSRHLAAAEAVWAAVWLAMPLVLAGPFLALAHGLVRL